MRIFTCNLDLTASFLSVLKGVKKDFSQMAVFLVSVLLYILSVPRKCGRISPFIKIPADCPPRMVK